jgi:hypothetical protein
MAKAAELLQAYREHGGLDAEDAVAFLSDFLSDYGITDTAISVLCDYIDDEGLTEDFADHLRENGLIIEPGNSSETNPDI